MSKTIPEQGSIVRTGNRVLVSPYAGMSIEDQRVLKLAAESFVSVLPKAQPLTIREWAVLILEEARSRRAYRRYQTYRERIAAETTAGHLLSLFIKYGVPS